MVRETSESTRQETEELRSRIRELESQLTDIRSLLKLKSDQLAQMQVTQMGQAAPLEGVSATIPTGDETPPADSDLAEAAASDSEAIQESGLPGDVVDTEETAALEAMTEQVLNGETTESGEAITQEAITEPVLTEEFVEQTATLTETGVGSTVNVALGSEANEKADTGIHEQMESRSNPQLASESEAQLEQAQMAPENPAEKAPLAAQKPAPGKPVKQPGLLEKLRSDPTVIGIGGAVGVILLSLGWLLIRRRRQADDEFDESMLMRSGEGSSTVAQDSLSDVAEQRESEEETSFISDFSPSDIDALQEETGEVDPAAEADVYIAYGRYQQAESLVNLAIEKEPERLDLKAKLLEIYFTTKNAAAFAGLAEKLQSIGAQTKAPQLWKQVESMGRELIPGHDLFGSADDAESGAVAIQDDFPQIDSGAALIEEPESLQTDSEAIAGLDLDLDSEPSEIPDQLGARPEDLAAAPPLELKEGLGLPSNAPTLVPDTAEEESEFSIDLADLDSLEDVELGDLGREGSKNLDVANEQPAASSKSAGANDDGLSVATEEAETLSLDELETEGPTFALDQVDLEEAGLQDAQEIKTDDSEPLSELLKEAPEYADEEIETKLDLARAYMEMGDGEGAREILKEVLGEGSDEQKSVAQELMSQAS
jgi:pilus assembly protein FimV